MTILVSIFLFRRLLLLLLVNTVKASELPVRGALALIRHCLNRLPTLSHIDFFKVLIIGIHTNW